MRENLRGLGEREQTHGGLAEGDMSAWTGVGDIAGQSGAGGAVLPQCEGAGSGKDRNREAEAAHPLGESSAFPALRPPCQPAAAHLPG